MDRFTLDALAVTMRGMPRDALILIRMPDGRLVDLDHVTTTYVRETDGGLDSSVAGAGAYAIVLVPKESLSVEIKAGYEVTQ